MCGPPNVVATNGSYIFHALLSTPSEFSLTSFHLPFPPMANCLFIFSYPKSVINDARNNPGPVKITILFIEKNVKSLVRLLEKEVF